MLELLQVLGKTNSAAKNRHPSDDMEPTALENESLGEERSDNNEPGACSSKVVVT